MAPQPDWARVKSALANSGFQNVNNAAYQSILQLIDAAVYSNDILTGRLSQVEISSNLENYQPMKLVELAGPITIQLDEYCELVGQLVIFKDYAGDAGSNNITLAGDVDGVTDPVINTNYGVKRVYKSPSSGAFLSW